MRSWVYRGRSLTFATLMVWSGIGWAFEIYGFIPYSSRIENDKIINGKPSDLWFRNLGIRPIKLVYEDKLLDVSADASRKQDSPINIEKIMRVAKESDRSGVVMVSLDLESWNRFSSETPARFLKVLQVFRSVNPHAKVGLYSTVPQNTYVWHEEKHLPYDKQNEKYSAVADAVDYYSPSLYNYSLDDFESWKQGAKYNVEAARKYSNSKKIFPYVTPEVNYGGEIKWLSYEEMLGRLKVLKELGVDGCIIWTSSRSREASGKRPALDPQNGWLKAVIDFNKSENGVKPTF